jgi:hypothetical protein
LALTTVLNVIATVSDPDVFAVHQIRI